MYAPWHIKFKKKNVFKLASIAPKNNINKIGFLAKYLYFHIKIIEVTTGKKKNIKAIS